MPCLRPRSFSRASSAAGDSFSPLIETASPFSKPILTYSDFVGRVLGMAGARIDVIGRLLVRVLEHLAFGGGVQKVGVGGEGRVAALVLGDGDLMRVFLGEFDQVRAGLEVPFAPRRDHGDVGLERVIAELEAHLIVALARGAMADGVGADLARDLDLLLGDQRAGDGGAEQIDALIDALARNIGKT